MTTKKTRTYSAADRCRCGAGLVFEGIGGVWLCAAVDAGDVKIVEHCEHDAGGHSKAKWDGDNARVFKDDTGRKHDAHRAAVWIIAENDPLAFGCSTRPADEGKG